MNRPITDEQLNDLADYFVMRKDLHKRGITLDQFVSKPEWYGYEVPVCEIEEMECCF